MSKVPKISELSKMVRNDIIKQFLRKSIVKKRKRTVYVKNIKTYPNGKKC